MCIIDYIFRKHIFTAGCAAIWTYSLTHYEQATRQHPFYYYYLVFVFIAVLIAYNYQYVNKFSIPATLSFLISIILLPLVVYYALNNLPASEKIIPFNFLCCCIVYCLLCTLLYKKFLRNIPYLKALVIASCWTFICAVIPYLLFYKSVNLSVFIEVFLLVFSISVLFDIKHMNYDIGKIKTIATLLGKKNSKLFCVLLLSVSGYLGYIYSPTSQIILFYVIAAITVIISEKLKNIYLYQLTFDGLLILHGLMLLG